MMYYLAFSPERCRGMKRQVDWAAGKLGSEDVLLSAQSNTEAYYGQIREARDFSRRAVESALRAGAKGNGSNLASGRRIAKRGDWQLGTGAPEAPTVLTMSSGTGVQKLAGVALARAGDVSQANATTEQLDKRNPTNTLLNYYWVPTIPCCRRIGRQEPCKGY